MTGKSLNQPPVKHGVNFRTKTQGVPVEKGKNWITGLSHDQRKMALRAHENFWKTRYNSNRSTIESTQNFSQE